MHLKIYLRCRLLPRLNKIVFRMAVSILVQQLYALTRLRKWEGNRRRTNHVISLIVEEYSQVRKYDADGGAHDYGAAGA